MKTEVRTNDYLCTNFTKISRTMHYTKSLCILALLYSAKLCLFAQETSLDSTTIKLNELLVEAPLPSPLQEAWQGKRIGISRIEAQHYQPQTTADLLGHTGAVFIQKSQQGGGSPMIRGFATNRLLYSVDGVRMNTAIYRRGNIQNVISLDPLAVEQTEVLLGAGSTLYGSDAIGGVMDFRTLTPRINPNGLRVTGSGTARYASANREHTGHFDIQISSRRWALLTSVSHFDFGDLRQGSYGPEDYLAPFVVRRKDNKEDIVLDNPNPLIQTPSAYSQTNLMQKALYQINPHWRLEYAFHLSETSPYGRYDRHSRRRKGLPRYAEWNYGPQKWLMNVLHTEHRADLPLYNRLDIRLALQNFEESRIDRAFGKNIRSVQTELVDAYSINVDLQKTLPRTSIAYGAEYVLNAVRSLGESVDILTNESKVASSRYPQASWHSLGIYAQATQSLSSRFRAYAGARWSMYHISADFTNPGVELGFAPKQTLHTANISANIGLTYQMNKAIEWDLKLSRAFRAPNVDDMGKLFDPADHTVVVPNPSLRGEYAHGAELTGRGVFSWGEITLSGYYTHLSGALILRPYTLPSGNKTMQYRGEESQVYAMQNAAYARVYGAYLNLSTKAYYGLSANLSINYQKGQEELENGSLAPLRHAAPLYGQAGLEYRAGGIHLSLIGRMQSRLKYADLAPEEQRKVEIYAKDSAGKPFAPAWVVFDLRGKYIIAKPLDLVAGVENIADVRYRPYSSGISSAGRSLYLGVTYRL